MQGTFNLAWKLAAVIHGQAGDTLASHALDPAQRHLPGQVPSRHRSRPGTAAPSAAHPGVDRTQSPRAYRRAGRLADGWFPRHENQPGPQLDEARELVHTAAVDAGRDPADVAMEGRLNWHGDADELIASLQRWREAGASYVSVNTMGAGLATVDDHLAALARAAEAAEIVAR
jgi:hypothetical protein